jgi:hypothetical protein
MNLRIHENGGICCSSTNSRGERTMPEHPCDKCKEHFAKSGLRTLKAREIHMEDFTPPDPYDAPLQQLRAALALAPDSFAARYASDRAREFEREQAGLRGAERPALRTLTAEELKQYVPPDPYAAGIARMRGEGR